MNVVIFMDQLSLLFSKILSSYYHYHHCYYIIIIIIAFIIIIINIFSKTKIAKIPSCDTETYHPKQVVAAIAPTQQTPNH